MWVKLAVLLTLMPVAILLDSRLVNFHAALIGGAAATLSAWLLLAAGAPVPPAFPSVLAGVGFAFGTASALPLLATRLRPSVRGRIIGLFLAGLHIFMIVNALCIGALRDASAQRTAPGGGGGKPETAPSASRYVTSVFFLAAGQLVALILAVALAAIDGCREPEPLPSEDGHGKKA